MIRKKAGIRLDIGCGQNKQPGYIGMDSRRVPGVDIVHDITKTPWPLPANCVITSVMSHLWEHIPPWRTLAVMEEIHRISKPDAVVLLSGPFGLGFRFVQDPTHCNPVNEATFAYWDPLHPSKLWEQVYQPSPMHIEAFEIVPANGDRDFECALRVCKTWNKKKQTCSHARSN